MPVDPCYIDYKRGKCPPLDTGSCIQCECAAGYSPYRHVEVPVRNLGKPGRVSRNFQMHNETGTMVCTWHIPSYNGFHDLHNEHVDLQNVHVDLGQWLGQVYPRRPVHCAL